MEKLLRLAEKSAEQAEIFSYERDTGECSVRNFELREMASATRNGFALRIIKGGRMGTAYTTNLTDREDLVMNALSSLKGQVAADYSFPEPGKIAKISQYDKRVESMTFSDLYDNNEAAYSYFEGKLKGQVDCYTGFSRIKKRVMNSSGVDFSYQESTYFIAPQLLYPNTETSVTNIFVFNGPKRLPQKALDDQLAIYLASLPIADIESGKKKVIFWPSSMYSLMWRFTTAASGRNFYEKTSPLVEKVGQKLLSESVTIYNDPLDTVHTGACPFDDEGIPARRLDLFDRGTFNGCYVNLDCS